MTDALNGAGHVILDAAHDPGALRATIDTSPEAGAHPPANPCRAITSSLALGFHVLRHKAGGFSQRRGRCRQIALRRQKTLAGPTGAVSQLTAAPLRARRAPKTRILAAGKVGGQHAEDLWLGGRGA